MFFLEKETQKNDDGHIQIAVLSAFAIILHSVENLIPSPIPWLKFGFSNIITLTALILYGLKAGMMITIVRTVVVAFLRGTLFGPSFILSLGGGMTSTFAMWMASILFGRSFSPIGLSLIGALIHNITQLFIAHIIFIRNVKAFMFITPIMLFLGTLTGAVNGIVVSFVLNYFNDAKKKR